MYQESEYGVAEYDTAGTLREGRIPEHQLIATDRREAAVGGANPAPDGAATDDARDPPGRRQEDDVNIVAYPISGDALRGEGTAKTPSADAEGSVRLRDPGLGVGDEGDPAFTPTKTHPGAIAFHATQDPVHHHHHTPALSSESSGNLAVGVRRLTPRECERLQGFPDGWTQLGDTADSKRYSALGDAVTVNVAEWIGGRLAASAREALAGDGE